MEHAADGGGHDVNVLLLSGTKTETAELHRAGFTGVLFKEPNPV